MIGKCPFSGQKINKDDIKHQDGQLIYPVKFGSDGGYFSICNEFAYLLQKGNPGFLKELNEIRKIILWEWLDNGLKDIGWNLHWNCSREKKNHVSLEKIKEELLRSNKYPTNRKQLQDNFLLYIKKNQDQDGGFVKVSSDVGIWGKLFFNNYLEMQYYIEELERKGFIIFESLMSSVQLTFSGLDYVENLIEMNKGNESKFYGPTYEIGLSFAGEQREFVDKVAKELSAKGVKVFYDTYEQSDLWGKDLYQHLNDIYRNKCKFCIVFLSKQYAEKLWTRHELEAAQARAFKENEEYILPVKFDETEIPGINPTTGYLSASNFDPKQIAEMAIKKLASD